jgi:gamma-glutamylcyclotransferase (GGCT)/AIG2-like uncharacterized protein YtfP
MSHVGSAAPNRLEHVFVYGTLKQGQERERCWPLTPQSINRAWTHGRLYDLGPYPALLAGNDRVLGQVWSFLPSDIERVLVVLDEIEGTNQGDGDNLYDRELVTVYLDDGSSLTANTYFYADAGRAERYPRHLPDLEIQGRQYVVWPSQRVS